MSDFHNHNIINTKKALEENGIQVFVVENGQAAKEKVLQIIPEGAQVMTMTSETLRTTGIADEINNSGKYDSVRKHINQQLGAAPEWTIGSVHAVTEDGKVVIASASGSQLPAYAYGALHVVWVVGWQKIVKDLDQAIKRVYEYVLPLENERAMKAYGQGSSVNKLLIVNKESLPNRIIMIIVKEKLGF